MDWNEHHAASTHAHAHGHGATGNDASPSELAGFVAGLGEMPRAAVDLGCGTGADAVLLARFGIRTTGVDASSTALMRARERANRAGVDVTWVEADALALPLESGSIDLATDRGLLHHFSAEDQAHYAAEVARILRPGGTLLVREMNQVGHHAHAVDEAALRAMIADAPLRLRSAITYETATGKQTLLATIQRTTTED